MKTPIKSKHSPSITGDDSVQNFETNTNKVVFQNFETGHAHTLDHCYALSDVLEVCSDIQTQHQPFQNLIAVQLLKLVVLNQQQLQKQVWSRNL